MRAGRPGGVDPPTTSSSAPRPRRPTAGSSSCSAIRATRSSCPSPAIRSSTTSPASRRSRRGPTASSTPIPPAGGSISTRGRGGARGGQGHGPRPHQSEQPDGLLRRRPRSARPSSSSARATAARSSPTRSSSAFRWRPTRIRGRRAAALPSSGEEGALLRPRRPLQAPRPAPDEARLDRRLGPRARARARPRAGSRSSPTPTSRPARPIMNALPGLLAEAEDFAGPCRQRLAANLARAPRHPRGPGLAAPRPALRRRLDRHHRVAPAPLRGGARPRPPARGGSLVASPATSSTWSARPSSPRASSSSPRPSSGARAPTRPTSNG